MKEIILNDDADSKQETREIKISEKDLAGILKSLHEKDLILKLSVEHNNPLKNRSRKNDN